MKDIPGPMTPEECVEDWLINEIGDVLEGLQGDYIRHGVVGFRIITNAIHEEIHNTVIQHLNAWKDK